MKEKNLYERYDYEAVADAIQDVSNILSRR